MTNSFVACYEPGPNWLEDRPLRDQPLKSHVDYLLDLHSHGKVTMGGPFQDGSGGIVVFDADCLAEVNDIVSQDPAIVGGILIAAVRQWSRIV